MTRDEVNERLSKSNESGLWIEPLLENDQIGDLTIDLRLGYDFLVSVVTRDPSVNIYPDSIESGAIEDFFQPTSRDMGEDFVLYPNQTVLTTTLEYIGLPNDCYADIVTRSSFNKFGMSFSAVIEPGYRGCIAVELMNHGNNPVKLVVGARMFQMQLTELAQGTDYGGFNRKYLGLVRPVPSRIIEDYDLAKLKNMGKRKKFDSS